MRYGLLILFLLGFLIRAGHLNDRNLTGDERETVLEANGIGYHPSFDLVKGFSSGNFQDERTFANVLNALVDRDSGNGFVYVSTLFLWVKAAGNSNMALRLVSLAFSLLTIFLVYAVSKEMFEDTAIAFSGAAVFTFHEVAVRYGQEARPYSMAVFFVTLSVFFFIKIMKRKEVSYWIVLGYGLSAAFAFLTHYFISFILIAQGIVAVLFIRDVQKWKYLIVGACIVSLMALLWMYSGGIDGLEMMNIRNENYKLMSSLDPNNSSYGKLSFRNGLGGFFQMIIHSFGIGFQNSGLRIAYNLPVLIIPFLLAASSFNYIKSEMKNILCLLIFVFIIPFVALMIAINAGHIVSLQAHYTNFSIPMSCILIGLILIVPLRSDAPGKVINIMLVGIYSLSIIISNQSTVFPDTKHATGADIQMRAGEIEKELLKQDTLLLKSKGETFALNLFFKRKNIIQKVDSIRGKAMNFTGETYY